MINILELNERYYQLLTEWRQRTPELRFTFRRSNYAGRLDEGFWFYGKETFLAISFWAGMDWRNRTPNIIFRVRDSGQIYLEISVSDSDRKREFVEQFLVRPLRLVPDGRRYIRLFIPDSDLNLAVAELEIFLRELKPQIDELIQMHANNYFSNVENSIGFISEFEFSESLSKIEYYYKKLRDQTESDLEDRLAQNKPIKIRSLTISNYGPLQRVEMLDIPKTNQWIFITGENGTRKTNFLRSLATVLGNKVISSSERERNRDFRAELTLHKVKGDNYESFHRDIHTESRNKKSLTTGFCVYGPYRLKNSRKLSEVRFKKLFNKAESFTSLFSDDGYLLDLERQFELWQKSNISNQYLEKRKYYISAILTDIVPGLVDIRFEGIDNSNRSRNNEILYITRKTDNDSETGFLWDELASGTKSIISLLADIMLRLYNQQPAIVDPAELTGVVIIDEIDLHLHPIAQKELIQNLSKAFPLVQFIVTTHSPIPLLGAPRNSRIYVMRKVDDRVDMVRMDDKVMFNRILPNGLLSSPIFGLDNLLPVSKEKEDIPYLEESFTETQFLDRLERDVSSFLTNEKQKELLNLFIKRNTDEANT